MPRKSLEVPLFWQDKLPPDVQELVRRRRHQFVQKAAEYEPDGFRPATQVTLRSRRLLEIGPSEVRYMVVACVRGEEEAKVRAELGDGELEMRLSPGSIVPIVPVGEVRTGKHFVASKNGFTIYVRQRPPQVLYAEEEAHIPLGNATAGMLVSRRLPEKALAMLQYSS